MDHDDDLALSSRLAALEARAPATGAARPAGPGRRRGRFAVSMAMAPVFVLAVVATAAAGAFVVANLRRGTPGDPEPGPAAGRRVTWNA